MSYGNAANASCNIKESSCNTIYNQRYFTDNDVVLAMNNYMPKIKSTHDGDSASTLTGLLKINSCVLIDYMALYPLLYSINTFDFLIFLYQISWPIGHFIYLLSPKLKKNRTHGSSLIVAINYLYLLLP